MTWDVESHLANNVDSTGTTTYIYDANGNRLIRRDPAGKTLYLPGQELRYDSATATRTCSRYYAYGGAIIASRTAAGLTWLAGDHQGTAHVAINEATQQTTARRQTPFGMPRGTPPTWPNSKGFVGGTQDNTGLIHLGAREYDPAIGRFISVDPIMDLGDPQQMHGYAYANNTPVTSADPDGLIPPNICLDECGSTDDEAFQTGQRADRARDRAQEQAAGSGSGSKCGNSCKDDDDGVLSRTTYKNGTVLIVHDDGRVSINGYMLPGGYKDPNALAVRIDELWSPYAKDGPAATILIPGLIARACNPDICTRQLYDTTKATDDWLFSNLPGGVVFKLVAYCVGGSAALYQAVGGSLCGGIASDGIGVYLSPGAAEGPAIGYFGSPGGLAVSNGGFEAQRGAFDYTEVGGKIGIGVDAAYAHSGGIWNTQLLFGVGGGGGVASGTSNSIVWHLVRW